MEKFTMKNLYQLRTWGAEWENAAWKWERMTPVNQKMVDDCLKLAVMFRTFADYCEIQMNLN